MQKKRVDTTQLLNDRLRDLFLSDYIPSTQDVRQLLSEGANPDVVLSPESQMTPLMRAADWMKTELFQTLVEFGADVRAVDADGDGILSQMVHSEIVDGWVKGEPKSYLPNLEEIVDTLVAGGCDIDARDSKGKTPLMTVALYQGKEYFADVLLRRGADVHSCDAQGNTPLLIACMSLPRSRKYGTDRDITSLLIVAGADTHVMNLIGYTPMLAAIEVGNYEAYDQLRQWDIDPEPSAQLPKLTFFTKCLRGDCTNLTNPRIKDVIDERCLCGRTPLMWVAETGDLKTAEWLITSGADVHLCDEHGWTPLSFAVQRARTGMCAFLLDSGADLHALFSDGDSPEKKYDALSWAVERNGADMNGFPYKRSHLEVIHLLLEHGGRIERLRPRQVAHAMVGEVLQAQRASGMPVTLYDAALANDTVLITDLVVRGADPNEKFDGETPIYIAAAIGKEDAVNALIKYGARVNVRAGSFGWTPLMRAASGGYTNIANALIAAGADESARDSRGWDAKRFASEGTRSKE